MDEKEKFLRDALWNGHISAEECQMIREFRKTGRKGFALVRGLDHLPEEKRDSMMSLVKEAYGVAKVLYLPDFIKVERI